MPGSVALASPLPSSSTATLLAHAAHLQSQILTLRDSNTPDPRLRLARLLSLHSTHGRAPSPAVRALQTTVQSQLEAYGAAPQKSVPENSAKESALYNVAISAVKSFVALCVEDASSEASVLFANLCEDRDWTSLALFSASSVAEEALKAADGKDKRITVIDAAPDYHGRAAAKRLASATESSIRYGLLSNCQRLLDGVHVIVIGAEEVTMNGAVLAAPGAGLIAQVAKEIGIPIVVTTQAIKFSEGMVVDWTFGEYDVLCPDEVLTIVTEFDLNSRGSGIGAWEAPDILQALAQRNA